MEQEIDGRKIDPKQWLLPEEIAALIRERFEQGRIVKEESDRGGVQYRTFSDPLDFYWRKRLISGIERRAGDKLSRLNAHMAVHGRFVRMRYGEATGHDDAHDSALVGLEFIAAVRAIRGVKERKLAYLVCCEGHMAGRGNIIRLQNGLTDLARHFGFV